MRLFMASILATLLLLTPAAVSAGWVSDGCADYLTCTDAEVPCTGELTSGITLDLTTWDFLLVSFDIPRLECYQSCEYTMEGPDGDFSVLTFDSGCDGDGIAIIVSGRIPIGATCSSPEVTV